MGFLLIFIFPRCYVNHGSKLAKERHFSFPEARAEFISLQERDRRAAPSQSRCWKGGTSPSFPTFRKTPLTIKGQLEPRRSFCASGSIFNTFFQPSPSPSRISAALFRPRQFGRPEGTPRNADGTAAGSQKAAAGLSLSRVRPARRCSPALSRTRGLPRGRGGQRCPQPRSRPGAGLSGGAEGKRFELETKALGTRGRGLHGHRGKPRATTGTCEAAFLLRAGSEALKYTEKNRSIGHGRGDGAGTAFFKRERRDGRRRSLVATSEAIKKQNGRGGNEQREGHVCANPRGPFADRARSAAAQRRAQPTAQPTALRGAVPLPRAAAEARIGTDRHG
ncbi:uncharacterized protein LOC107051703 isoform X1 [Gallus gallus]|uniref:uncharacterized protein LOC107051703 isoform X1 n=1 Tax=Gallus gallus TaxID=9031 RepID=UPI001F028A0D|nr:uncharacterized protein LOC107051703 isoform X1 [Gallus gallus]